MKSTPRYVFAMALATALFGQIFFQALPPAVASSQGGSFRESFYGTQLNTTRFIADSSGAQVQYGKLTLTTGELKTIETYGYGTYSLRAKGRSASRIKLTDTAENNIEYHLEKLSSSRYTTYKLIVNPGKITWYINGRKISETTKSIADGDLTFSIASADPLELDWIRFQSASPMKTVVMASAAVSSVQSASSVSFAAAQSSNITIKGDENCKQKTSAALALLKNKTPTDYEQVVKYIGVIECVEQGSGMWAWESPPRYTAGKSTYEADTLWYAGTIAHDAHHSALYHDYQLSHPGQSIPSDIYTGEQAEADCLKVQYDALARMGATASTLDYLKNVITTKYWTGDYANRWW